MNLDPLNSRKSIKVNRLEVGRVARVRVIGVDPVQINV